MLSEPKIQKKFCVFLQMILYDNGLNQTMVGPDWVRMNRRYQVFNNETELGDEQLNSRAMSYCTMLGGLKPVQQICETK